MRKILNINENWMFYKDTAEVPSVVSENAESVNLPHTWNALDGQDGGDDYYRGTCIYEKTVKKPVFTKEESVYLQFHGVNASAKVIFNGKAICEWRIFYFSHGCNRTFTG